MLHEDVAQQNAMMFAQNTIHTTHKTKAGNCCRLLPIKNVKHGNKDASTKH